MIRSIRVPGSRLTGTVLRSHRGDQSFENFETLLRAVLSYPSKPAVIILQTFKLDGIIATGGDSQMSLAQYYDVPMISARNWVLPMLMRNPEKMSKFYNYWVYEFGTGKVIENRKDLLHPNADGHKMMADTIIMYLQQQVSRSRLESSDLLSDFIADQIASLSSS